MTPEDSLLERNLYEVKWFDYRMVSPDGATILFIAEYARRVQDYRVDVAGNPEGSRGFANVLRGFDLKDPKAWGQFGIMQTLRRFADKNCIPYGNFWKWAFRAHLDGGWKIVQPKIFLQTSIKARVIELQDEHMEAFVTFSLLPVFSAENYKGHEIQKDYYYNLVSEVNSRYPNDADRRLASLAKSGRISREFLDKCIYVQKGGKA